MKKRLVIILTCLLVLSTAIISFSNNGEYEGFSIVNIIVNNKRVKSDIPAVIFFGKTMMPVREVSESLKTIAEWNSTTKTVNIIKPEIDMIIAKEIQENSDGSVSIANTLRMLQKGNDNSFKGLLQIEGLIKGKYTYRIVILNPSGEIHYNDGENQVVVTEEEGSFIRTVSFNNIAFEAAGTYQLVFQMKQGEAYKTLYQRNLVVY